MSKIDNTQESEEKDLTPEELEIKEKKEADELIKRNLNDPKFLNFLQKNPDAIEGAKDDQYLRGKISVFETVQGIKNQVKKFITSESSADFGDIVEGPFIDSLEGVAIKNPDELLGFSEKISAYIAAMDRNKALEEMYQQTANQLGIGVDYNKLTTEERVQFVNDVQSRFDLVLSGVEQELSDTEKGRGLSTHFSTKARATFRAKRGDLEQTIAGLKLGQEKLDQKSILTTLDQIKGVRESLKGNEAFEILKTEFNKRAVAKMKEAWIGRDFKTLAKNRVVFERMKENSSVLDDTQFEEIEKGLNKLAKKELGEDTGKLADSKEGATLNSFEKGVDVMRKKGLNLGLSIEECNEQITITLKDKIKELEIKKDPQARIKIILANRILANLE